MTAGTFQPQASLLSLPTFVVPLATVRMPSPTVAPKPARVAASAIQPPLLEPVATEPVAEKRALWTHQQDVVDRTRDLFGFGHKTALVVIPTGGGKTGVMAAVAAASVRKHRQVLITTPTIQLVTQTIPELILAGIPLKRIGIIGADTRMDPGQNMAVYVGCIDSVNIWAEGQGVPGKRLDLSRMGMILIDEAHHSAGGEYNCLFRAGCPVIGYTATPICGKSGPQLGDRYTAAVVGPSMAELINTGHLVQPRYYQADSIVSGELLERATLANGEYDQDVIAAGIEAKRGTVYGHIVDTYMQYGEDRQALVFAPSIAISRGIIEQFKAAGYAGRAAHIDGTMSKLARQALVDQFRAGNIDILSSVECFREGFDAPTAGVLLDCNPVRSLTRHLQALGRVVRAAAEKSDCIVLDLVGNLLRHGLAEQPQAWNLPGWTLPTGKAPAEKVTRERKIPTRPHVCPHCPAGTTPMKFPVVRSVQFGGIGHLNILSGERKVLAPNRRVLSVPPMRCPSEHAVWGDALPLDCQTCEVHSPFTDGSRICSGCGHKNLPEVRQEAENARELESGMVQISAGKITAGLGKKAAGGPSEATMRLWLGSLRGACSIMRKADGTPFHPAWADHKFEEKFGVKPASAGVADTRACRVAPEVAAWIKSQDIRRSAAARGKARREKLAAAAELARTAALPEAGTENQNVQFLNAAD